MAEQGDLLSVADMTWDQVAGRLRAGAAAILPVGAGAKQHGLHLPMNTDAVQAEWFARRLAERVGALAWPTLTYGSYPAFAAFAGSVSLEAHTFESVVLEIVDGLAGHGARSVFVLNAGLSTIQPIERALARRCCPVRAQQIAIWTGTRCRQVIEDFSEQAYGSHADEAETSLMLAIAPQLVAMSKAAASPQIHGEPGPGAISQTDASSASFAPSGCFGDPTLASADKGRVLAAAILADVFEAAEHLLGS